MSALGITAQATRVALPRSEGDMNRYEILERLGDGSFGEVTKARSLKTNEIVAIKKMKTLYPTWEECLQLRELKSLRVLRHENVVQLKEVIRDKEELYFVFEYMQSSLHKVMRHYQRHAQATTNTAAAEDNGSAGGSHIPAGWLSEPQIKSIMYQLFSGLAYMHKHGFFHRDIKPENLLCHDETLKIADLGQAREIRSRPPFTDYVSTRWYRSPELLLRFTTYNSPIDMWACGCIMAELYLQTPLFTGTSEADQLCRIAKILGSPTKDNWPEGSTTVAQMQFKFPKCAAVPWKNVLPPYVSKSAIQMISELLQYDPSKRLTASQAMQHRFFDQQVPRPVALTPVPTSAASVAPLPASMISLPLKAEQKGGNTGSGWAIGGSSNAANADNAPTTSRWWRESSSALPATASHSDVLASSRKQYDSGASDRVNLPLARGRLDDQRADAKTSTTTSYGGHSSKNGFSSNADPSGSSSWLSARKWTSPELEDDDDDVGVDDRRADEKDDRRDTSSNSSGGDWKRSGRDDKATARESARPSVMRTSSSSMSFKSQDNMLQDLLDEFLA